MEEQIEEHETTIIKLKRARNSLLNVSKLPPETLGEIFRWNTIRESDFGPLEDRSHNFLLVCHHWFEVASCTPELWSFWGNNLQDWRKQYLRHPTAPLDLVFNGSNCGRGPLDDDLRNALQDRTARDTIRQIHLTSRGDSEVLDSIISPLVNREGIRSSSVESIILQCEYKGESPTILDFFAHYRFPKLQRLVFYKCPIPSWDLVVSKTSVLTTLTLDAHTPSPTITPSQLLSILRSNPSLREIVLSGRAVPDDGGDESSRVSLTHLRKLEVAGRSQDVFALLHQLDHPRNMDRMFLDVWDVAPGNISKIVEPYLRDYFQRRGRSHSGLGLDLLTEDGIDFRVEDTGRCDFSPPGPGLARRGTFARITIRPDKMPPQGPSEEDLRSLIASVPQEEVVYIRADSSHISMQVMSNQFPYLRAIRLNRVPLHVALPESILCRPKIFPHLQYIRLNLGWVRRGEWRSLTAFLDYLKSSGNRLDKLELEIDHCCPMNEGVEERIRGVVRELSVRYVEYL